MEGKHFLFKKQLLPLLLDSSTFKKWKAFKYINWLLAIAIISFAIWNRDYRILLFLVVFPFLIITIDHWIFIFNMSLAIGIKLLFQISSAYFWFFVIMITIGYLLNKAIEEMIESKILARALSSWTIFWKFYSAKIVYMDETALNDEYSRLTEKYPELM